MIIGNNTRNANEIYEKIENKAKERYGKNIGEIKIFSNKLPNNDIWKLCDKNNILLKSEYPELYEKIGDIYKGLSSRTLLETEFCIPNLEGRYLAMRTEHGGFELTSDSIQAFSLESVEYYAYFPNDEINRDYFKSILDNTSKKYNLDRFEKPVKRIICEIKEHIRKSISSDDKIVNYYIRVR